MPGPRDHDWRHLRIVGDRAQAPQHLPLAGKVLGFVREQAAANGLQTYKHVVPLEGGGQVIGELIGGVPRVTIVTPPRPGAEAEQLLQGFTMRVASIDPVVFTPPADTGDWGALFHTSDSAGFTNAPKARRGVYSYEFGPQLKLDNADHIGGGTGSWVSQDGELVTWFRGYSAYWPEHYRHPMNLYGRDVHIYGHKVFTTGLSAWRVLAAAARDGWLYLMIGENLGAMEFPARPAAPSMPGDIWVSPAYCAAPYTYSLWRIPLRTELDEKGVSVYKADDFAAAERLWQDTLVRAYSAWTFNASVTECVSIQLPEQAIWAHPPKFYEDTVDPTKSYWAESDEEEDSYPTATAQRFALTITHDNDGTATASFAQSDAGGLIAEERGVRLELVEEPSGFLSQVRTVYKCGDWTLPARQYDFYGATTAESPYTQRLFEHVIIHAHLPTKTFVFYQRELQAHAPAHVAGKYVVYAPDADGNITEIPDADPNPLYQAWSASTLGLRNAMVGMFPQMLTGEQLPSLAGGTWAWTRPMDGVSFLLCLRVDRGFVEYADPDPLAPVPRINQWGPLWRAPLVPFGGGGFTAHWGAGGHAYGSLGSTGPWTWSSTMPNGGASEYFVSGTSYIDPAPNATMCISPFGSACTFRAPGDNADTDMLVCVSSVVQWQGVRNAGDFAEAALQDAIGDQQFPLFWGTRGEVATLLSAVDDAYPYDLGRNNSISHTGMPQPQQRKWLVN